MPHLPAGINITIINRISRKEDMAFFVPNLLADKRMAKKLLHFLFHLNGTAFKDIGVYVRFQRDLEDADVGREENTLALNPALLVAIYQATGHQISGLELYTEYLKVDCWSPLKWHCNWQRLSSVRHLCHRARRMQHDIFAGPDSHHVVDFVSRGLGRSLGLRKLTLSMINSVQLFQPRRHDRHGGCFIFDPSASNDISHCRN